ncbi:Alpha/Beta hydrolase protein [Amylocarpus encephaloides]|uniref:Alpha/Beta hydrolase protein n=1 Tax=Amylocarpus encephaloides TaxID=45428 RepID=A0A9P8C137_9HELO|nr:Alpha/Beta hydrolase protein [Amylocarpus encephaloides]
MWSSSLKYVLVLCLTSANAAPAFSLSSLFERAIPATQFNSFSRFSQWAGAAYCFDNVNGQGKKLSCTAGGGFCPLVQDASTSITKSFEAGASKTRGFVAVDDTNKLIVVSFQGTSLLDENPADIITDLTLNRVKTNFCGTANTKDGCEIHEGFFKAANDAQVVVKPAVAAALAFHPGYKVVATGHSLGGAVAALTATLLRNSGTVVDLYTYGQPHIGTTDISNYIQSQAPALGSNNRVTHFNDIVPKLPFHNPGNWGHYYPEYFINIDAGAQTAANIQTINGNVFSTAGNEGTSSHLGPIGDIIVGISAHFEYFGAISSCSTEQPGTKIRSVEEEKSLL